MEESIVRSYGEPNVAKRIELIKAMDMIARCINDEDILVDGWLAGGVPDGLVEEGDEAIAGFTSDENMKDFMDCFMRCMVRASKSGGLFYMD